MSLDTRLVVGRKGERRNFPHSDTTGTNYSSYNDDSYNKMSNCEIPVKMNIVCAVSGGHGLLTESKFLGPQVSLSSTTPAYHRNLSSLIFFTFYHLTLRDIRFFWNWLVTYTFNILTVVFRFGIFFVLQTVFVFHGSVYAVPRGLSWISLFLHLSQTGFFQSIKNFFFFFRSVLSVRGGKGLRVYSLICLIFTAKHCVTYGS